MLNHLTQPVVFNCRRSPKSPIKGALLNYKACWVLSNIHQECFSNFYLLWSTLYCVLTMILCTLGTLHFYGKMTSSVYESMPISMVAITSFSWYFYTNAGKHLGYFAKSARTRFQALKVVQSSMDLGWRDLAYCAPSKGPKTIIGHMVSIILCKNALSQWSSSLRQEMRTTFKSCKAPFITLGSTFPIRKSQMLKLTSFVLIQTMRLFILGGSFPT